MPIKVSLDWVAGEFHPLPELKNVSIGGLSFRSPQALPIGQVVRISFPFLDDHAPLVGQVVWNRSSDQGCEIGIQFTDSEQLYRLRMIEQVCHIEHYRQEVLTQQGRNLSSEEAAAEWIQLFADKFPGA